ncbi:MAG: TRAP transporter substrate-binding protein [Rhodobacteraceae bacterium]|nr:TRAP transporter substrate-binding protein [Paracoccaceae bacterium]
MSLSIGNLRRMVLATTVGVIAATVAQAQDHSMRLAHHFPTAHVQGKGYEFFTARVAELSDGRIATTSFPGASLISGHESFEAVRTGTVQASNMISAFQVGDIPELDVFSLPFQFEDAAHFRRTLDAGLFDIIAAEYEARGIKLLNYFNKGNIHLFHIDKHLLSPQDFEGEDIRGLGGLLTRTLEVLGANAISMPPGEVNAALQRGVVSAVMTNCLGHVARGWSEEAKYVSYLDLAQSGEGLGVNLDWWNSLPGDLQAVVQQAADEMENMEWDLMSQADNTDCPKIWADEGFPVARPSPEQRAALRAKVQPLYDSAADRFKTFGRVSEMIEAQR